MNIAVKAVIGMENIMKLPQSAFIRSTFWTEQIVPTAALTALEIMEKEKSWEAITKTGMHIRMRWQELADTCVVV